jgi:hypothetical protein
MTDMHVANTILEQLGGRRFLVMTGASNLGGTVDSLTMKLPSNLTKGRVTHVRITLTPADVYKVETIRVRGGRKPSVTTVAVADEVYCDMLQDQFLEMTGLFTRFGQ